MVHTTRSLRTVQPIRLHGAFRAPPEVSREQVHREPEGGLTERNGPRWIGRSLLLTPNLTPSRPETA